MRCSRSSWMTSPTSLELRRAGGAGQAGRPPLPERAVRAASAIASAAIFRAAVVLGGVVALNGALALCGAARAATLEVGPGRPFSRIEDAAAAARPGDVILIHPLADGRPYERTAVNVRQAKLTFRGVPARGQRWVRISGKGFDYSGAGSTPRAIFQFNRGTDDCVVENLELCDARNNSQNGAGVRINQANNVVVRHCSIHDNDMGMMSNGDGSDRFGDGQLIEHCVIHNNGSKDRPGYNHNLYLGGAGVTLRFCEVHSSTTGHNVKSRAHRTRVEYCFVHDSANREFDLVDAGETGLPGSDAVLVGNVIVKDPKCEGNRAVIHFGQDVGKPRNGTLVLVMNTIVTPFISPVVELSSPGAKARMVGNLIADGGSQRAGQQWVAVRSGAEIEGVSAEWNWLNGSFAAPPGAAVDARTNLFRRFAGALFVDPARGDWRPTADAARAATVPAEKIRAALVGIPVVEGAKAQPLPGWQYRHPADKAERPSRQRVTLGALEP